MGGEREGRGGWKIRRRLKAAVADYQPGMLRWAVGWPRLLLSSLRRRRFPRLGLHSRLRRRGAPALLCKHRWTSLRLATSEEESEGRGRKQLKAERGRSQDGLQSKSPWSLLVSARTYRERHEVFAKRACFLLSSLIAVTRWPDNVITHFARHVKGKHGLTTLWCECFGCLPGNGGPLSAGLGSGLGKSEMRTGCHQWDVCLTLWAKLFSPQRLAD